MSSPVQISIPSDRQKQGKKLRVAAYCRVSSSSADQLHSYAEQLHYYTRLFSERTDWEPVDIFADEGLSGVQADNRPAFQQMMTLCEQKEIDLIVTKSISRFGRNVRDTLDCVRRLKLLGIGIQFEKEGICTLSVADEMLLNTFAALAQEESVAISRHQRVSIVGQMERGEFVDNNLPYGFRMRNKKLIVYKPEADTVQWIFASYLQGMSVGEIARELTKRKVPTKYRKASWKAKDISHMLSNERYIGDCFYQKTFRESDVPFREKQNKGEADRYYAEGTHEAIIEKEVFEKVQDLLNRRRKQFQRTFSKNTYPYTNRIRCAVCGSFCHRKVRSNGIQWVCSKHAEDAKACPTVYYGEERITNGILTVINRLRFGPEDIPGQILFLLTYACEQTQEKNPVYVQKQAELQKEILFLHQMRSKGYLDVATYEGQVRDLNRQLRQIREEQKKDINPETTKLLQEVKKMQAYLQTIREPLTDVQEELLENTVTGLELDADGNLTVTIPGGFRLTQKI